MIAAAVTEGAPPPSRRAALRQRFVVIAVVFTAWAVLGLLTGWSAQEWAIVGFLLVVSSGLSAVLPPGRPVGGVVIFLSVLALGAVASIGDDEEAQDEPAPPAATTPTATAPGGLAGIPRKTAEDVVRRWFSAHRRGDEFALCLAETPRFSRRRGGCEQAEPSPSTPPGEELEFESLTQVPGGAEARVRAGDVRATVRLKGGLFQVDGVEGLPGLR